jgi:hypothetical protein
MAGFKIPYLENLEKLMDRKKLMPLVILQILPLILFPPSMLFNGGVNLGGLYLVATLIVVSGLLGWALMRGRGWALTLSILVQGLNVIIRLMMLFPNAANKQGVYDIPLILVYLIAIAGSAWFMLRFDRPDIRSTIVS